MNFAQLCILLSGSVGLVFSSRPTLRVVDGFYFYFTIPVENVDHFHCYFYKVQRMKLQSRTLPRLKSGTYLGGLAHAPWMWKKVVLIFHVTKIMQKFEHFWFFENVHLKCTPLQISKHASAWNLLQQYAEYLLVHAAAHSVHNGWSTAVLAEPAIMFCCCHLDFFFFFIFVA